jgi:hypothetical protein
MKGTDLKECVMANFKVLLYHLLARTKENHGKHIRLVVTISDLN